MKIEELYLENGRWQSSKKAESEGSIEASKDLHVSLVLLFGDVESMENREHYEYFSKNYPNASIVGASTAGTIENGLVSEHTMVATLIELEKSHVKVVSMDSLNNENMREKSLELIERLPKDGLKHIFVLMDGMKLNGALFIKAIESLNSEFSVSGGLAGDSYDFARTVVIGDGVAKESSAVAVGFYGDSLHVSVGCETGWEEFGAQRVITRSEGNTLYEIDNKPALNLYEDYLGEFIKDLPLSGLRFPLNIQEYDGDKELVRVMMGINEDNSLLFAGDVPQGSKVRLMKTNVNNLVEGARLSAQSVSQHNSKDSLALTVSCSGRRSVLKQLVDAELEAIEETLGEKTHMCGFYSYGELAPFSDKPYDCKLHNQTMTLTVIYED